MRLSIKPKVTPRKTKATRREPKNKAEARLKRKRQEIDDQLAQFIDLPDGAKPVAKPTKQQREEARKNKLPGFKVTGAMLAWAKGHALRSQVLAEKVFAYAKPMKGVVPEGKATLAMDDNIQTAIGWAAGSIYSGAFQQGATFLGYPYLAELMQRAEYRRVVEIIATEMTREWIEIYAEGDDATDELSKAKADSPDKPPGSPELPTVARDDIASSAEEIFGKQAMENDTPLEEQEDDPEAKAELAAEQAKDKRVTELEEEFENLAVKAVFQKVAELDAAYGRGHLFIDTGDTDKKEELVTAIGDGQNKISTYKLGKNSIKRLKPVEPVWTYPANYNSNDPLSPSWYKPEMWFVMGKEVHSTRLLTFIGREAPDLLKPAYAFGGLSLTQLCKQTVDNWLRTRTDVGNLIHNFSIRVLMTNQGSELNQAETDFHNRVDFFTTVGDNLGVAVIDKESEDVKVVSAPLAGLSELQAQSQEHICSVSGIPLVKFTGISPTGLNATSEFEMQAFYEWIAAFRDVLLTPNLQRVFHMLQINRWGKVDPDLKWRWRPLATLNAKEQAEQEKTEADRDVAYVGANILSPEDVRKRLSEDKKGPYAGIDPNEAPEPPEPELPPNFPGQPNSLETAPEDEDPAAEDAKPSLIYNIRKFLGGGRAQSKA